MGNSLVPSPLLSVSNSSPNSPLAGNRSRCNKQDPYMPFVKKQGMVGVEGVLLTLLQSNNSRIGELLSITVRDYLGNGDYFVRGKKRSRSYTVHVGYTPSELLGFDPTSLNTKIFSVNYRKVYSYCLKHGVGLQLNNRKNVSRTHAFRHIRAKQVREIASVRDCSDVLRHNSPRSISHYLN
jgi:hypothetical protein